ncbi:T9SS type A sorting domain-containing protein [Calditrichota bacterium]
MRISHLFFSLFCWIFLAAFLANAEVQRDGMFAILGFNDQRLVYLAHYNPDYDCTFVFSAGSLGSTANVLRLYDDDLWVVHSGDFSDGTGASLWHAPVEDEIIPSIDDEREVQWDVIELPDYSNPWDVAVIDDRIFVSLTGENAVVEIDPGTNEEISRYDSLNAPEGLAFNGDNILAVANSGWGVGNTVTLIDIDQDEILTELTVSDNPQWMAVHDSEFHILCSGRGWGDDPVDAAVYVYDTESGTMDSLALSGNPGEIHLMDLDSLNSLMLIGDEYSQDTAHVFAYNPNTLEPDSTFPALSGGYAISSSLDSDTWGRLFIGRVTEPYYVSVFVHNENGWLMGEERINANYPVIDMVYHQHSYNAVITHNDAVIPSNFYIGTIYPNPFNSQAKVTFFTDRAQTVNFKIFSIDGRLVERLVSGFSGPGSNVFTVDAGKLASGNYVIAAKSGAVSDQKRLTVIK